MEKYSWAREALKALYRYYESGLDTAGMTSEALMFEQWRDGLENGLETVVDSLKRLVHFMEPNNPETVTETLQMFVDGWDQSMEVLEDVVNQACTMEHKAGRNIIQSRALAAYDDAISYLVDQGRLVRLPGKIERFVWSGESVPRFALDPEIFELYPSKICDKCYELRDGLHWEECPRYEVVVGPAAIDQLVERLDDAGVQHETMTLKHYKEEE